MNIENLYKILNENRDYEKSAQMAAYMRNLFPFLGIQKTPLRKLIKEFIRADREKLDWDLVFILWEVDYREYQYIAMDYINMRKKLLSEKDFDILKELITNKSWWDTVDEIANYVGYLTLTTKNGKDIVKNWSEDENFWVRRTAIICQKSLKDNTDISLLEKAILNNLGSDEFFINKAIGWALREYSKINRQWVKNFIDNHGENLNNLSIREGSKYI